jgi:hypothetical protein
LLYRGIFKALSGSMMSSHLGFTPNDKEEGECFQWKLV